MRRATTLTIHAAALGSLLFFGSADAAPHGVKVGLLTCHVQSGWGFIVGSSKRVRCDFHPDRGPAEMYGGDLAKFGIDIGYSDGAVIVWDVVAPTSDMRPGSLDGDYSGATASATIGIGVGAHILLGGFDKSIALQPISVEGNSGLNVAAGIGALSLRSESPPPVQTVVYTQPPPAPLAPSPNIRRVVHHHVHYRRHWRCDCSQ